MADESHEDRTEAPTPKKRSDALNKGEVPHSQELTTAVLLLAGAAALAKAGPAAATAAADVFGMSAATLTALPSGVQGTVGLVGAAASRTLQGLAPVLLLTTGAALAISALQARGVFTAEPLKPKWARLDPLTRIPQLWGSRAVVELIKSLAKLALVGWVVTSVGRSAAPDVGSLAARSPMALLIAVRDFTVRVLVAAGLAYLVLALADYGWQVWQHEKRLRMSREEVKKEVKESEGDQVVKVRRRTMARQLARRRMLLSVSQADVVVTNPTHIAVALKYDPQVADAPVVLAMGERKVAERIKELAREHGVPTVENKPLARALFATARVGSPIPVELFVAVAEILAWVYRKAGYQPGQRPGRSWQGAEA